MPGERRFPDTLLTTLETYGRPVTCDVREYLTGLQLRATLDAEYARLLAEIEKLSRDPALARSRSDRADQRCLELESVLDVIDQAYADQNHEVDDPPAAPYADWGGIASRVLPLDDPYAVADFLSLLDRLGSRDRARQLADRVLEHFSDRRRSSDDRMKQDGLLPLLATMNRLRLYDQADKFSALLGYACNRYVRRSTPAVAGRFSWATSATRGGRAAKSLPPPAPPRLPGAAGGTGAIRAG